MKTHLLNYAVLVFVTALIYALDSQIPVGVATGVPYILVVLLSLNLDNRYLVLLSAAVCTVLVLHGVVISPEREHIALWEIATNRGLALFAIWTTAILGLQRLQIRKDVRAREEQLRLILEEAPDAVITVGADGIISGWNKKAVQLFGWTRKQAIGQGIANMIIPEPKRRAFMEALNQLAHTCSLAVSERRTERTVVHGSGEEFPAELSVHPLTTAGSKPLLSLFVRDVRERLHSEERIRVAFDDAPVAMVMIDSRGRIVFINKEAEQLFGYDRQELLGRDLEILVPSMFGDEHADQRRSYLAAPGPRRMGAGRDLYARRKDGSEVPVEIGLSPIKTGAGSYVLSVILDITARRQAHEQRALMAAIVESSEDAILTKNLDGVITSWNRGAQNTYGYSAEEAVGSHISLLVPDNLKEEVEQILAEVKRGRRLRNLETRRIRKDGTKIFVSLSVSPISDAHGNIIGASTIARDVTSRKLQEIKTQRRKREIEEFLHIAGHDLNKPLVAALWQLEILSEECKAQLSAEHDGYLAAAISECRKLQTMIGDLEQISKIERLELVKERVSLPKLIRDCAGRFEAQLRQRNVDLEIEGPDLDVTLSRTHVEEVLTNLIENALKHGCITEDPWIRIHSACTAQELSICVQDGGPGIDPKHHQTVFQLFARLNPGQSDGSGVGLAAVRRLMQLLSGRIELDSTPGKGAKFTIILPIEQTTRARAPHPSDERITPTGDGGDFMVFAKALQVLLVEDDPSHAKMIKMAINTAPFDCQVVHRCDGAEALTYLKTESSAAPSPDVVLLDISMPNLNGFEFLEMLRADPRHSELGVVIISTSSDAADVAGAYSAGANGYLCKSGDFRTFSRHVVDALSFLGSHPNSDPPPNHHPT